MFKIDHIGIAVNSLAESIPLYSAILDQNVTGVEEVPAESVRVAFFGEAAGRVELLEATDPDSPIARFIERTGPGIHHVCLEVPDLDTALRNAESQGVVVIAPGVRTGAGGRRVAFLHPRDAGGILVERSQHPEGGPRHDGGDA